MLWFSDEDLRRLAGAKSYERGVGYLEQVGDLDELSDGVIGSVQGTEPASQSSEVINKEQAAGTLWHWVGWKARQELDALAQVRRGLQQARHPRHWRRRR